MEIMPGIALCSVGSDHRPPQDRIGWGGNRCVKIHPTRLPGGRDRRQRRASGTRGIFPVDANLQIKRIALVPGPAGDPKIPVREICHRNPRGPVKRRPVRHMQSCRQACGRLTRQVAHDRALRPRV